MKKNLDGGRLVCPTRSFHACIRYDRIKALLKSVAGFTPQQIAAHDFIPGDAVIREFIGGSTIKIPHNERPRRFFEQDVSAGRRAVGRERTAWPLFECWGEKF